MGLLWFILIGIAAGWLAGQIMGGGGYGLLGDLILGVIGAIVGTGVGGPACPGGSVAIGGPGFVDRGVGCGRSRS